MPQYFIGDFEFISLSMVPLPPAQQLQIETRAGVDGVALWRTGVRGEPFIVQSFVDVPNLTQAQVLYDTYRTLIGADPVTLIFADIPWADPVVVLNVRPIPNEIRAILLGVGGVAGNFGPSGATCACQWDLIAIRPTED